MARGGARPGAGRRKGAQNKATVIVKDAASEYTEEAVQTLAAIMRASEHPAAARVSAANALLDRAHGKPKQAVEASGPDRAPLQAMSPVFLYQLPDNGRG